MANIFNLFGEISKLDKGPIMKPLSRSKASLSINGGSMKNIVQPKPKGLSIRSNSDLNVPTTIKETPNKQELKPKLTQLDIDGRPISPRKEFATLPTKKPFGSSDKIKDVSPKNLFNRKNTKSLGPSDESVFKKPWTPKNQMKKSYPEPESLAPYCDMQFEFDDIYSKTIENEFKQLLMQKKNKVILYEDEGFVSDQEQIDFDMPEFCNSPKLFEEEKVQFITPDLPEISDCDDNF
ncbi:uncharacterized protein LOC143425180 [Xylocopa sonorina]|uniref:uncharacterized protein LOC143425180 n=1 Tax=Xylocopa sonorina TaxID=1818115 RepID=UPI00403B2C3F